MEEARLGRRHDHQIGRGQPDFPSIQRISV